MPPPRSALRRDPRGIPGSVRPGEDEGEAAGQGDVGRLDLDQARGQVNGAPAGGALLRAGLRDGLRGADCWGAAGDAQDSLAGCRTEQGDVGGNGPPLLHASRTVQFNRKAREARKGTARIPRLAIGDWRFSNRQSEIRNRKLARRAPENFGPEAPLQSGVMRVGESLRSGYPARPLGVLGGEIFGSDGGRISYFHGRASFQAARLLGISRRALLYKLKAITEQEQR